MFPSTSVRHPLPIQHPALVAETTELNPNKNKTTRSNNEIFFNAELLSPLFILILNQICLKALLLSKAIMTFVKNYIIMGYNANTRP